MFDTVSGLPVHVLVVHAVVVLLPLMALVTALISLRARWRRFAPVVLGLDLLVAGIAFVAKLSGEQLQARLAQFTPDVAREHGEQGDLVWIFALGLVVAALVIWLADRRPDPRALSVAAVVLAIAAGAGATGWVVRTGDSGARSVWEQTITNTRAP